MKANGSTRTLNIVNACSMNIQVDPYGSLKLETLRPPEATVWHLVASGYWSEGIYHSGHIAYYITSVGSGSWLLEGVERNTILDDVTEEDVEEGWLNDDQIQAMWGADLEEAQSSVNRWICAACSGASEDLSPKDMAVILYRAYMEAGGKQITEHDGLGGLLSS